MTSWCYSLASHNPSVGSTEVFPRDSSPFYKQGHFKGKQEQHLFVVTAAGIKEHGSSASLSKPEKPQNLQFKCAAMLLPRPSTENLCFTGKFQMKYQRKVPHLEPKKCDRKSLRRAEN